MKWLGGITNAADMNLDKLQEMVRDREPGMLQSMGSQRVRQDWVIDQQQEGVEEKGRFFQRVQTFSYTMKKLWVSNVQHGYYS